ncbi:ferrochelatase [Bifidobacterium sp. ESL0728]|uniref:ferrochelatase n=1 Tax=Bifidobacterium sp. ESL0728 TaxID=2983220 RepID=UPI0023F760F1|nr:ferrochelatase [Bifidobacterium sp. ESL0728]WEV58620.1 ferrochelatase [Bifidobacterium sp. ESL0728]
MGQQVTAVLLMGFGTPCRSEDMMDFCTCMFGGHKPSEQIFESVKSHYDALNMGGVSPLAHVTDDQAGALQRRLDRDYPGQYKVYTGFKYIAPFIKDVADQIVADGITDVRGISLAPQYSTTTNEEYHRCAEAEFAKYPHVVYTAVRGWWAEEHLVQFWADRLDEVRETIDKPNTKVLLVSHSVKNAEIEAGNPYRNEAVNNARAVAERAGLADGKWSVAWQCGGPSLDKWLAPDIETAVRGFMDKGETDTFVVAPLSFIADNVEILYDIDIVLKANVEKLGGSLVRLRMPNDDSLLIDAMEDLVREGEVETPAKAAAPCAHCMKSA